MDLITAILSTAQITATAQITPTATAIVNQQQSGALTSDNLIAIAAIAAAFLGTVATLFANYKTNKDNNRSRLLENEANIIAKRREIVFTERIKALSEIISKISSLKLAIRDAIMSFEQTNVAVIEIELNTIRQIYDSFVDLYHDKRMYIPQEIDRLVVEYSEQCRNYIPLDRDPVKVNEYHDLTRDLEAKIIAAIYQLSRFQ